MRKESFGGICDRTKEGFEITDCSEGDEGLINFFPDQSVDGQAILKLHSRWLGGGEVGLQVIAVTVGPIVS